MATNMGEGLSFYLLQNFHQLAVIKYLYRGCRAVFTTRHSNRKLFIVMALSTTSTQYAPKITKFLKNHAK